MDWVPDNERQVFQLRIPEAIVVHAPSCGLKALSGIWSGKILEEETGRGEKGVSCPFRRCSDGGKVLKPLEI
jgi:hypothetical protein